MLCLLIVRLLLWRPRRPGSPNGASRVIIMLPVVCSTRVWPSFELCDFIRRQRNLQDLFAHKPLDRLERMRTLRQLSHQLGGACVPAHKITRLVG